MELVTMMKVSIFLWMALFIYMIYHEHKSYKREQKLYNSNAILMKELMRFEDLICDNVGDKNVIKITTDYDANSREDD